MTTDATAVPLKRFLYTASVESVSGWQTFYIDAETKDEADERAAQCDTDGIYMEEVSIEDIVRLNFDGETDVSDFGGYARDLAPASEMQADGVRVDEKRIPVNLTYEQISALYLLLLRRERPAWGWMEQPLAAIEEGLKPAHSAIHDRGFNSMNRQFFGDDRFRFDEAGMPTEIAPAASAGDQS